MNGFNGGYTKNFYINASSRVLELDGKIYVVFFSKKFTVLKVGEAVIIEHIF